MRISAEATSDSDARQRGSLPNIRIMQPRLRRAEQQFIETNEWPAARTAA